jgi:hypothetical protein
MAKKMKLALHIGTEKTGTTLLQEWLYHNRERLGQQGYFLSEKIGLPCNRNIVSYFRRAPDDFWNRYNIRSLDDKARFFAHFLEDLQAELDQAAQTNHTVIMSSEHFHSRLHDQGRAAETVPKIVLSPIGCEVLRFRHFGLPERAA